MTQKITDSTSVTDEVIYVSTFDKPVKVVYEGEPITKEEALKLWFEILQKFSNNK